MDTDFCTALESLAKQCEQCIKNDVHSTSKILFWVTKKLCCLPKIIWLCLKEIKFVVHTKNNCPAFRKISCYYRSCMQTFCTFSILSQSNIFLGYFCFLVSTLESGSCLLKLKVCNVFFFSFETKVTI